MGSLRVIGGRLKGRKLRTVPGDSTRPITDRAKESLFNIIGVDVKGSSFLDLFAGTGSVGIEALSRGASYARFIDRDRQAAAAIRANLSSTELLQESEFFFMDSFEHLKRPIDRNFDYVFIAPPQYKELWTRALLAIDQNLDWLSTDAWVIVQIHPVEYKTTVLENLEEFDQRQYGSVLFVFYETRTADQMDKSKL